jgi:predicted RNase H-like HicB family nuclease
MRTRPRHAGQWGVEGMAWEAGATLSRSLAEQRPGADCLQRPLRSRFRQQLRPSVRPLRAKKEKTKIYNSEPRHAPENPSAEGAMTVNKQLTMVYWKGERFWLGKLLEHPDIMTQGETLEELEDNLKDAYRLLVMDDVPDDHHTKAITL